ncbi:mitochondrial dicarboxylate carrier-like [Diabrotica virgifera virgifera]|uniref:Mitochondrial dicarboxylate carrier n=1 Tax=Diabrotica virgifera virgifera TaxID=50390 RepID=A0ABM5KHH3_DIAVI|nr:mitochondrial dicarboxylate carrier-like [Diabrotica virgifera virgifera]
MKVTENSSEHKYKIQEVYSREDPKLPRWYFGGIAGAATVLVTHPIELLKVLIQVQKARSKPTTKMVRKIIKTEGFLAFYSGLSASISRQLTYSTAKFALYEQAKYYMDMNNFSSKVMAGAVSGFVGGWVGVPADIVNVRMQSDIRRNSKYRRNYRNVVHGLMEIYQKEGFVQIYRGSTMACMRSVLLSVGQLSIYDELQIITLRTGLVNDNLLTHLTCSLIAGIAASLLSQPFDMIKIKLMNAEPGEYKGVWDCVRHTSKSGPRAFFKGVVPSAVKIIPNTVIGFIVYEQLIKYFGYVPRKDLNKVLDSSGQK